MRTLTPENLRHLFQIISYGFSQAELELEPRYLSFSPEFSLGRFQPPHHWGTLCPYSSLGNWYSPQPGTDGSCVYRQEFSGCSWAFHHALNLGNGRRRSLESSEFLLLCRTISKGLMVPKGWQVQPTNICQFLTVYNLLVGFHVTLWCVSMICFPSTPSFSFWYHLSILDERSLPHSESMWSGKGWLSLVNHITMVINSGMGAWLQLGPRESSLALLLKLLKTKRFIFIGIDNCKGPSNTEFLRPSLLRCQKNLPEKWSQHRKTELRNIETEWVLIDLS